MASMSVVSLSSPQNSLLHDPCSKASPPIFRPTVHFPRNPKFPSSSSITLLRHHSTQLLGVAQGTSPFTAAAALSDDERTLFIGNLPRKLNNTELSRIVGEHGSVEKAQVIYGKHTRQSLQFAFVTMKTVEDAKAVIRKLNGVKIRRHKLKINYKKRQILPAFIKSPYKVFVGNLSKRVTADTLKQFFSDKAKVLSADVLTLPGDSASSRYGVVLFWSNEDVEAVVSSFNGAVLEGQKIRVNKA